MPHMWAKFTIIPYKYVLCRASLRLRQLAFFGKVRMFMSTKNSQNPVNQLKTTDDERTMTLIWSMADTTWRMFTPPALLVPAGIWADLSWGTKPWLTAVATVAGLGLSVLLVKRQLGEN